MFIRDKQRADCGAAAPGPTCREGTEGDEERGKERGGKRLSNIINLHSLLFAVARAGTAGCAWLHLGIVEKGRTPTWCIATQKQVKMFGVKVKKKEKQGGLIKMR